MSQRASKILVYISCRDTEEASLISTVLLKKRLAACIQVLPHVKSSFLWPPGKSSIDTQQESLVLIKTIDTKLDEICKEIKAHHSYENPEIIGIPVPFVRTEYLSWLRKELSL